MLVWIEVKGVVRERRCRADGSAWFQFGGGETAAACAENDVLLRCEPVGPDEDIAACPDWETAEDLRCRGCGALYSNLHGSSAAAAP